MTENPINENLFEKLGKSQQDVREVRSTLKRLGDEILTALPDAIPRGAIATKPCRVSPQGDSTPREYMWVMFAEANARGYPNKIHPELAVGTEDGEPYVSLQFNAARGRSSTVRDRLAERIASRPNNFISLIRGLDGYNIKYKPKYQDSITKSVSEVSPNELAELSDTGLTELLITRRYYPADDIFSETFLEETKSVFHDVFFPLLASYGFSEDRRVPVSEFELGEQLPVDTETRDMKKIVGKSATNFVVACQNGYWAFDDSEHYQRKLDDLSEGDIILFELSTPEGGAEQNTFIGFGIFEDDGQKTDLWFPDERDTEENKYPLTLTFSDTYWLGDVDGIPSTPYERLSAGEQEDAETAITTKAVTRQDIIDETGYHIPQMNLETVGQHRDEILARLNSAGELTHRQHNHTNEDKGTEYFILKTGADEYVYRPDEKYHFRENIPGSRQLREPNAIKFIYLEDGEFYARGRSEQIDEKTQNGRTHYFAAVDEYEELDEVRLEDVRGELSVEFPFQYGIVRIGEEDYEKIIDVSEKNCRKWSAPADVFETAEKEFSLSELYFPAGEAETRSLQKRIDDALRSDKHIILTGPPGSGKTELAKVICDHYVNDQYELVTATDDWSTFDTIGGYRPQDDDTLEFKPGVFLRRFLDTESTLTAKNEWLIIDELNRADIDKAFGSLFSALTGNTVTLPFEQGNDEIVVVGDPETEEKTPLTENRYYIPEDWRMIATMNTDDKASLYKMSYAFMRRFAFVSVPVPEKEMIDTPLVREYADRWEMDVPEGADWAEDISDPTETLFEAVADLWTAVQRQRPIGPALIRDILSHLLTQLESGGDLEFAYAIRMYVFPQLEGLPDDDIEGLIGELDERIDQFDAELAKSFATDFLGADISE